MGEKLIVGPINKGLRNDRTAFVIDNDSFPTLINAYQWRARVKRKRGTSLLTRLQRFFNSTNTSYSSTSTFALSLGAGNLFTGFSLQVNGNIIPGSVKITDTNTGNVYQDLNSDGALIGTPSGTGTVNYTTGDITIASGASHLVSAGFLYNPDLPVMGLEDLNLTSTQFPGTLAFDTTYSYNILTSNPYPSYDVSFYKNPATGAFTGYTQKTNATPVTWNGQTYQQFWTTNYQGALWATNGINIPFVSTNLGMQFKPIVAVTITAGGPPAIVNLQITGHGLVIGDFLFINEVATTTGINFQTGYVTNVVDANNVTVEFPNATIATNGTGGIAQYLTNRSDKTKDCMRWYDGDPTNGNVTNPTLTPGNGWVNFCPPLSQSLFSISDLPAAQYYLVTARMVLPFKDRLLMFGPVIQNSSGGIFYLQDTIIYSQNGTPYYTASFSAGTNYPLPPLTGNGIYNPILVPLNQTATPSAWFEDSVGFGGFVSAGISQPITTVSGNEDVLIVGFSVITTRLVYSGNDLIPFNFYIINSELGNASTFSTINMDKGVITRGSRGFQIASQVEAQRIDLEIPDEVFEINLINNGNERFCAARDFINEWIYFTFPVNTEEGDQIYPDQTLLYNYRDNSWAIFFESYTTYGLFRRSTGFTWATVGQIYPTWSQWNEPWNAGTSTLLQQEVIAGNQQGFVLFRDEGTGEGTSLYIQSFSGNTITSPDHNMDDNDFIMITGCIGTISSFVNNKVFQVFNTTKNTFQINPNPNQGSATYVGGGLITRLYVPFIQTKQFPVFWEMARKTRIGPQQYLLTTTNNSQITLLIFLSQNSASAYNIGNIIPAPNVINDSLIYSTILYTCPENTNLGLTPANINLQMPTAAQQDQIWHRINTSLIGDTVQLGFTVSDAQMFQLDPVDTPFPITGASQAIQCILQCVGQFETGVLLQISGVVGMTQLNGNIYSVVSSNTTTVTLNVDSRTFTAYVSGGTAQPVAYTNIDTEIELHSFVLDLQPSQLLA